MGGVEIRPATTDDSEAIADIYNHYVRSSTATFDTVEKTIEERQRWLSERTERHPVLVVEDEGGAVVGWGALSPWSPRPAWGRTCEVAVYLHPDARGAGVGSQVLNTLVELARAAGHHALISQIVGDNAASISMTERAGFTVVGTLKEVGWKFDRWLDVVVMELVL